MKIIGGKYKNRNFFMPKAVRPTQNLVRKAFFDTLGQDFTGLSLLELFAGSGAVGLEAASRGAESVTFVENDPKAAAIIEQNISLLESYGCKEEDTRLELLNIDAFAAVKSFAARRRVFDVIYMDPPYGRELAKKALKTLCDYDILHPNSTVAIEHHQHEILPDRAGRILLFRRKNYGSAFLSFYHIDPEIEK